MSFPDWWLELAAQVESEGHTRYSASWWAAYRDAHFARFPDSDERTKENLRLLAASAAAHEGVLNFEEPS